MNSLITKIQQLPYELMRIIYLYIPDRLPFQDELIEKYRDVEYVLSHVCSSHGHSYLIKKSLKFCYTMTNKRTGEIKKVYTEMFSKPIIMYHDQFLRNKYMILKWHNISVLRKIATKYKIKGRSKLKTHNEFIHAFLKNDVLT